MPTTSDDSDEAAATERARVKKNRAFCKKILWIGVAIICILVVGVALRWFFWPSSATVVEKEEKKDDGRQVQYYPDAKPAKAKSLSELKTEEALARGELDRLHRSNQPDEVIWAQEDKVKAIHAKIIGLETEEAAKGTSIQSGASGKKGLRASIDWDGNGRIVLEAEDSCAVQARLQAEIAALKAQPKTVIIEQVVPYGSRRIGMYH